MSYVHVFILASIWPSLLHLFISLFLCSRKCSNSWRFIEC